MLVKKIGTLFLFGLIYVELGASLECYSCNSPWSCKGCKAIICNADYAHETSEHLSVYYKENLTNIESTKYECFYHNYTSVNTNVTYKGCIFQPIKPCRLNFKDEFSTLKRQSCYKCPGNLCNPAGTFSSSMITMFTSLFVIAVYKVLNV